MNDPLRVLVLGLDEKARNLFRLFFRGLCKNDAVIVDQEKEADAFLIDLDSQQGRKLLAQQRDNYPDRLLILLSVKEQAELKGSVFVKKPVQAQNMLFAIEKVRLLAKNHSPKAKPPAFGWASRKPPPPIPVESPAAEEAQSQPDENLKPEPSRPPPPLLAETPPIEPGDETQIPAQGLKIVTRPYQEKTSAHKVAMLLDEQGFRSYLGHRDDIDPTDPGQLTGLFYDPKVYLQGQVQKAIKVALVNHGPILLETPWKNITILPQQGLIHILADEAQVRAACGIPFRNIVGPDIDAETFQQLVHIKPVGKQEMGVILHSKELVRLDAFLWKVALLTSKGRLPKGVDLNQAFFLKRWPCMTRLMLPPHAMRIAALLSQQPQSLFEAARKMRIRQQYVFAFVSAAHALGLIGQQSMEAERPPESAKPSPFAKPERQSLFRKILSHLKFS